MVSQEDIADLFGQVIWHGRYFAVPCPYHDSFPDNPSFLVYPDGAVCLSASCRKKTSLAALAKHLKHSTAPLAAERPSAGLYWASLPLPEDLAAQAHQTLYTAPDMGAYLKERRVSEMIGPCRLGWFQGWYTVPVLTRQRRFGGLVLRAGPSLEKYAGRYVTPPGQRPMLFCPNWALVEKSDYVFVPFGIFDALALAVLGLPAITPTNIQAADPELFADIRKTLVVIPDRGEELVGQRLVSGLDWRGELSPLPTYRGLKDPADFLKAGKSDLLLRSLYH